MWPSAIYGDLRFYRPSLHAACLQYGKRADGSLSYVDGANVVGFVKVAEAMLAQGVI